MMHLPFRTQSHEANMTTRGRSWPVLAGMLTLMICARAMPAAEYLLEEQSDRWFVRGGTRVLFNVKASVQMTPTTVAPGVFDDGFVLPALGGTGSGTTWNWGYQESGQINSGQVRFSRLTDVPLAGLINGESDTGVGGEVLVGTELSSFRLGRKPARLGWEIGYAYNPFSVKNSSLASGSATLTVAAHNLGSLPAPSAPHVGTFEGPGPVVELAPAISSSQSSPATSAFDGEIESSLHNMKLGLWMEYMLTGRMKASVSAGYSSIFADTKLRYTESSTFDNPGFQPIGPTEKRVGGRDWQPGIYTQVRVRYDFSTRFGAYLGGDLQYNKSLKFHGNGRDVTLDLGPVFAATAGLTFHF